MKLKTRKKHQRTEAQETSYKLRKAKLITFTCFMSIYLVLSICFYVPIENLINGVNNIGESDLKIHFVDVGHGDACIIELPDDKVVLIDTGPKCDNLQNYISHTFRDKIKFDYLILTHTDSDHIGNALSILHKYEVDTLFRPKVSTRNEVIEGTKTNNDEDYAKIIELAKSKNINLVYNWAGHKITGDNYEIEFLSPNQLIYEEDNNYSPIIKLTYLDKKVLFTGDAEGLIEEEVLSRDLKADILKVGHHGSKTSSSYTFLKAVAPTYAVVSCETGVYSDVPSKIVLNRLIEVGVSENNILRTDQMNSIIIGLDQSIHLWTSGCADKVFIKYYYIMIVVVILAYGIIFQSTIGQKR